MRRDALVIAALRIVAVGRPPVIGRCRDHHCAYGIEFDVAMAGEHILFAVPQCRLKAAFL